MQNIDLREKYRNHAQVWELLPWYINGSLPAEERLRIADHVAVCLACHKELGLQAALRDSVKNRELDELIAVASFDRLSAKLHEEEAGLLPPRHSPAPPARPAHRFAAAVKRWLQQQFIPRFSLAALPVLALVVLLPVFTAQLFLGNHTFRTLSGASTAAPVIADLRLIFADGLSAADRKAILDSAGLSVVAGPNDRGLYLVDAPAGVSVSALAAKLEQLRRDENVMFAELAVSPASSNQPSGE